MHSFLEEERKPHFFPPCFIGFFIFSSVFSGSSIICSYLLSNIFAFLTRVPVAGSGCFAAVLEAESKTKTKAKIVASDKETSMTCVKASFSNQKFGLWLTQTGQKPPEFVKFSWSFWNPQKEAGRERFCFFFFFFWNFPLSQQQKGLRSWCRGNKRRGCTAAALGCGASPCMVMAVLFALTIWL